MLNSLPKNEEQSLQAQRILEQKNAQSSWELTNEAKSLLVRSSWEQKSVVQSSQAQSFSGRYLLELRTSEPTNEAQSS